MELVQRTARLTAFALGSLLLLMLLPGPAPAYGSSQYGSAVELYQGSPAPVGIAVGPSGTVYWVNYDAGELLSLAKGASSSTVLLSGLSHPQGVAVDSQGNIYFDQYFDFTVSELPLGSSTPEVLFNAGTYVTFLALDQNGNVFVVTGPGCNGQASTASSPDSIVKWSKSTGSTSTIFSGQGIGEVYVSSSENVYYATCGGTVDELPAGSITPQSLISGLSPSTGVAVDSSGDVIYTQYSSGVYELLSGSTTPIAVATAGETHYGLTLDSSRDIFYTDNLGGGVWEVPVLTATQTTTTTAACTSSASGTITSTSTTTQTTYQGTKVTQLWTYRASNPIVSLKLSGDGNYVLIGTDNGSAYLLNMKGQLIERFDPTASNSAEGQSVVDVALSYNASSSVAIKSLYNYAGVLLWEFAPGPGGYTVSVSPGGSCFAASSDAGVEFFRAAGQTMNRVWSESYTHGVEEIRASVTPDAGSILVESEDNTLSLLSASDGLPMWSTTFSQPIIGFASSYNSGLVAVTLANGIVSYLNGNGTTTNSFSVPDAQIPVVSVPSSSDPSYFTQNLAVPWAANYVLVGNNNGSIDIFNSDGAQISSVHAFSSPVQYLDVSANGEYIAAASGENLSFLQAPSLAEPVTPPQVQSFSGPFASAFVVVTVHTGLPTSQSQITQSLASGTILGTISVGPNSASFTGSSGFQVTSFSAPGSLRILIGAQGISGPRVLLLNISKDSFLNLQSGYLEVLLDNQTVPEAASLEAVLTGSGTPSYILLGTSSGFELLLSIPHFSTHTILIATPAAASNSGNSALYYASVAVAVVVMAVVAIALALRRQRGKRIDSRGSVTANSGT